MNRLHALLRCLPPSHPIHRQMGAKPAPSTHRLPKAPTAHMKQVGARVLVGVHPDVAEQIYINTLAAIPGSTHQRYYVDAPILLTREMMKAATDTLSSRNQALACHVFNVMVKAKPLNLG